MAVAEHEQKFKEPGTYIPLLSLTAAFLAIYLNAGGTSVWDFLIIMSPIAIVAAVAITSVIRGGNHLGKHRALVGGYEDAEQGLAH